MSKTTLKVTRDFVTDLKKVIESLKNDEVLVGVPAQDTSRKDADGEDNGITNAAILAINEFGSPVNNIPPRPVLSTGIRNSKDQIAEQFKKAAQLSLAQGSAAVDRFYERAGIIASNACKQVINEQDGFEPLAASTLKSRKRKGFQGENALIVTGQLKNSITYVVAKKRRSG